jgi:hypothetical protein
MIMDALLIMLIVIVVCTPIIWYLVKTETAFNFECFVGDEPAKVGVVSLIRKPIDFKLWLGRLREVGVAHFFLRIEDTPEIEDFLKTQADVSFVMAESDKSNNYTTLQHRQIDFVNKTIATIIAEKQPINWVFHIDSDELFEGSFAFLDTLPKKYKCVKIENVEALYKEREDSCFSSKKFLKCSELGAQCRSYVNGKAGGRVDSDVKLAGPHDFSYKGAHGGTETYKAPFKDLHILHYDSCTFGAWVEKFNHLSKDPKDIPFAYYKDSIKEVVNAHETYKKYTGADSADGDHIYRQSA